MSLKPPRCQSVNSSPSSATYVSVNQVSINSDNGLSIWRQIIIWTNAGFCPGGDELANIMYTDALDIFQP